MSLGVNKEAPPKKNEPRSAANSDLKLPKPVRLFLLRFAHSNAYVPLPILAITIATYMQIGDFNWHLGYVSFLFFSTLFLYPLHRLIGLRLSIPLDYSTAQKSVSKKPKIAQISVLLGLLGTVYFTFQLPLHFFQFLIPLGIISMTYSLPFIPTTAGWKRLRDIPGVKIYAITLVVTFTTSTIPLLLNESIAISTIIIFGIQRFLFILAITIPFDIRDLRIDRKWKLKTIPLLIGTDRSIYLSKSLLLATAVVAILHALFSPLLSIYIGIAIILSCLWTYYIVAKFKTYNAPLFNAYMLEGSLIFQFALITMTQVLLSLSFS